MPTVITVPSGTAVFLVVAVLVIAFLGAVLLAILGWRRKLRNRFGPEYERTVGKLGRYKAEWELYKRQRYVEHLHIRPLPEADRERFSAAWQAVQLEFVDNPGKALARADELVAEVMNTRGYPVRDFERRTEHISVDHPRVVESYRVAHNITLAQARGQASTEQIRQAILHYRALFDDLLPATQIEEYTAMERH